jgi:hypothetical protein
MTYKQAAKTALDCQDGCNLSGTFSVLLKQCDAICEESHRLNQGTDWRNHHPIVTLFLSKLVDLNGREAEFFKAFEGCERIAERPRT